MSPTVPQSDTLSARFFDLLAPLQLLLMSLLALPRVLLANPFLPLTSPRAFRSKWFASLWTTLGPQMALSPDQTPYISSLLSRARGTVLELGPGSGDQMRHFLPRVSDGSITRIVGAEPNATLHARLRANARGVGLEPSEGRYIILEAGAEPASLIPALHRAGLYPSSVSEYAGGPAGDGGGVFDTIICVKSMCSAPQDQIPAICATLQAMLRPGGEFLFFEHVANDQDYVAMAWAWLLGWVWPLAMGNCHLDGRIDRVVKQMGGWDGVDVRNTKEFRGWNMFRYVVGVCRKR